MSERLWRKFQRLMRRVWAAWLMVKEGCRGAVRCLARALSKLARFTRKVFRRLGDLHALLEPLETALQHYRDLYQKYRDRFGSLGESV